MTTAYCAKQMRLTSTVARLSLGAAEPHPLTDTIVGDYGADRVGARRRSLLCDEGLS